MKVVLKAEGMTASYMQRGKESLKAVDDISLSLRRRSSGNCWRIRLWEINSCKSIMRNICVSTCS